MKTNANDRNWTTAELLDVTSPFAMMGALVRRYRHEVDQLNAELMVAELTAQETKEDTAVLGIKRKILDELRDIMQLMLHEDRMERAVHAARNRRAIERHETIHAAFRP